MAPVPPLPRELHDARDELVSLINVSAEEAKFQALFTRCPYLLSRALPLRLEPTDFQSIARPGRSDPDFIFYSRGSDPLWSFGVVELKRPQTRLLTTPRRGTVILSRDAATAVAQAEQYRDELQSELRHRLTATLVVGAADYIFVIAGLTDELVRKLKPPTLLDALNSHLPARTQIIPYDELLRRYESSLPARVLYFSPVTSLGGQDLIEIVGIAEEAWASWPIHHTELRRIGIDDEKMTFWSTLEDRWRAGNFIGTAMQRVIDRPYWCVVGTNELAGESPAHIEFPLYVGYLVECLQSSLRLHSLLSEAQSASYSLEDLHRLLPPGALAELGRAVAYSRANRRQPVKMQKSNPGVDLLDRLGLIHRYKAKAGETYYEVDPLLHHLWA
jgi:hypothetical protein